MSGSNWLLGIDVGTTHCKAGLFGQDGALRALAGRPTLFYRTRQGVAFHEPEELWATVVEAVRRVLAGGDRAVDENAQSRGAERMLPAIVPADVAGIGITSMAETGCLIDRRTGASRSSFAPWFDTAALSQVAVLNRADDPAERFRCSGIHATYKCSLAKLLWLAEQEPGIARDAVWLSAADYVAWRLSGRLATDLSLAARTYAFCIAPPHWDAGWLARFGLDADLFPPVRPAGERMGRILAKPAAELGLPAGLSVAIAGHDHICAAFASGIVERGRVLDSLGTAESFVGAFGARPLDEADFTSGLTFGPHVVPGLYCWMGAQPASGGSLEWLRMLLGEEPLPYQALAELLKAAGPEPIDLLYFPYLLGSQIPLPGIGGGAADRGAFVGLDPAHGRPELLKAVLQGTAYEMELIRRRAQDVSGAPIDEVVATGGGTRLGGWLQIKADVSGCRHVVSQHPEAALLGTALLGGVGAGVFSHPEAALHALDPASRPTTAFVPDPARHTTHLRQFETGYMALQEPLRRYYAASARAGARER